MKFSIIIPVYNTEKYLRHCIESVLNQTHKNYEIIVIDDGSTDGSGAILDDYKTDERFKIIRQENHGQSHARNVGIEEAQGDYILFLDSDDLLESWLLEKLEANLDSEDILKFAYADLEGGIKIPRKTVAFKNLNGEEAIVKIIESRIMFDMTCIFAYKTDYLKKYRFQEDKYHEDFGLIPILIYEASVVSSIDEVGYIYNRENSTSITSYTDDKKEYKKAIDTLYFFEETRKKTDNKYLLSFYANGAIWRLKNLNGKYKKMYTSELKNHQVYKYILDDSLKRKIKKIFLTIRFKLGI